MLHKNDSVEHMYTGVSPNARSHQIPGLQSSIQKAITTRLQNDEVRGGKVMDVLLIE